jgi:hypothetical protein
VENGNGKNGNYTAEQFIKAIPGSAGIISTIAKRVGCVWHTAKKYIDKMPTVQRAYRDECEAVLDLAETKLLSAINEGDGTMIRYYLSTKGKNRGFSERYEIDLRNLDLSQLSESQLERIAVGEDPFHVLATPS